MQPKLPSPVPRRLFNNDLGDIIKISGPKSLRKEARNKLSSRLKMKMNNGKKDYQTFQNAN